jgi:hypothetical protein
LATAHGELRSQSRSGQSLSNTLHGPHAVSDLRAEHLSGRPSRDTHGVANRILEHKAGSGRRPPLTETLPGPEADRVRVPIVDLYLTAAQVIPVFFLVLVFDSKALVRQPESMLPEQPGDPRFWNTSQVVARIYVAVALGVGEAAALIGIGLGSEARWITLVVVMALFFGVVLVTQIPVRAQMKFWRAHKAAFQEQGKRPNYSLPLLMVGLFVVLTAGILRILTTFI